MAYKMVKSGGFISNGFRAIYQRGIRTDACTHTHTHTHTEEQTIAIGENAMRCISPNNNNNIIIIIIIIIISGPTC